MSGSSSSTSPEDALRQLLGLSKTLGETSDLASVLGAVINALRDLLHADRATVFTFDSHTEELVIHVAHGVGGSDAEVRIPASAGIAGACATSKQVINIPDAYSDQRFNREVDRRTGYRTKSILAVPLLDDEGHLVGVAQVLNCKHGAFDQADEMLSQGIASQAAIALRRAQLIEDNIDRARLMKEMAVAKEIQEGAFPKRIPEHPAFDVFARSTPAEDCGGDSFDVFATRAKTICATNEAADQIVMFLADATGHGVGPAISSMQARGMMRMGVRLGQPIDQIARDMNVQLSEDLPPGRFITAFMAVLDLRTWDLQVNSAGQGPIYIYRRATDTFEEIESDTPPFGILIPGFGEGPCRRFSVEVGDILVLITDGYFEAQSPLNECWGEGAVCALIRRLRDEPCESICDALDEGALSFAQAAHTDDDRTAIILRRRF